MNIYCMPKIRRSITIDKELIDWIKQQIACRRFKDVSHAFEYAMYRLKEEETAKKSKQISIDVTNQTPDQCKDIFKAHFNQHGFKQFSKTTNNHKTIYQFSYN
jgi:Arc/MetJ-type ribon-helix-helix transcriptional regulator